MNFEKVAFKNKEGDLLSGRIDFPINQYPTAFAIFAHCFTCSKNLRAVTQISRALTQTGIAVLRFDFTGLGDSEGHFEDTSFSGNVTDLQAAASYLNTHYTAPSLLIGHSLGGAAVLYAAKEITSVTAVVTIGAPANPKHVTHLFKDSLDEISTKGHADVALGGRTFTLKKEFVDDLHTHALPDCVKTLRKPYLILHSPQDDTVGIKNAETLYHAAHHPKSFISLDGADHLITQSKDAAYVGHAIAGWVSRYLETPKLKNNLRTQKDVVASLHQEDAFTTQLKLGIHPYIADEPASVGGNNFGPTPYELVSGGLSACTAMTLQMYARLKKWDLKHVEVHTTYNKTHAEDCESCETKTAKIDVFERHIKLQGNLDDAQKKRLLQIANKCPVHKTLESTAVIKTKWLA